MSVGAAIGLGVGAIASVVGAKGQKKAAEQAGAAFNGVGQNINPDQLEAGVRQLMGSTDENKRYESMRDNAFTTIRDQQMGRVSEATRVMLGRRAVESGAVGLGVGAVNDNYAAYLGISQEQIAQQGMDNYRAYLGQLTGAVIQNNSDQYAMQYNKAAAQAGAIQQSAAATSGMWSGIAQLGGAYAGGAFGSNALGSFGSKPVSSLFGAGSRSVGGI